MKLFSLLHNKKALSIIIPLIFVGIYAVLIFFSGPAGTPPTKPPQIIAPTRYEEGPALPSPTIIRASKPPVVYDDDATIKLVNVLRDNPALSPEDNEAEKRLINSVNGQSAVLSASTNFRIEYIDTADSIMVEIMTTDVAKGKREAAEWFFTRGFSSQALCDRPVVFYLNWDIAQQLRELNLTFSPLAEGC